MIVVDSSAIVAVIMREGGHTRFSRAMGQASNRLLSAANYLEAGAVLANHDRLGPSAAQTLLDAFLAEALVSIVPLDEAQAGVALGARIRYGKGFGHPAQLNYGDCFAYALAKVRNAPLLYVGDDFGHTDIASALI